MTTDPTILTEILPTGGVVALTLTSADQIGPWVLTRSIVGSLLPAVTVYSGPPLAPKQSPSFPMDWIDAGDGTTLPLNPTFSYTWTFTTLAGSVTSAPVQPACMITINPDQVTDLLIKLLQAGIESLRVPAGYGSKPTVLHAMPLAGQPRLPLITLNHDLMQQEYIGIGDSVNPDTQNNAYSVSAIVKHRFGITVIALNTEERKFYRDTVIAILRTMAGPALNRLGTNISHSFQAADSQVVERDKSPGFFYSTIMAEFSGTFNVGVTTNFGIVEHIDPEPVLVPDNRNFILSFEPGPAAI